MKKAIIIAVVVAFGFGVMISGTGMMLVETTRYFCASSGNWGSSGSWNTNADCVSGVSGIPDSDDPAVILSGKTANVDITTAECKTLTVQSTATVNIQSGKKLSIRAFTGVDSEVNGTVYLQGSASELFCDLASHTIIGSGAIVGQDDNAIIKVVKNKTLTLGASATVRGRLKIQTETPDQQQQTKFVNFGTVNADTAGILTVEGDVSDAAGAQWKVTAGTAKLLWSDPANGMVGNFLISAGEMQFDDSMRTTGTFLMTGGKVIVIDGGADFNI